MIILLDVVLFAAAAAIDPLDFFGGPVDGFDPESLPVLFDYLLLALLLSACSFVLLLFSSASATSSTSGAKNSSARRFLSSSLPLFSASMTTSTNLRNAWNTTLSSVTSTPAYFLTNSRTVSRSSLSAWVMDSESVGILSDRFLSVMSYLSLPKRAVLSVPNVLPNLGSGSGALGGR